MVTIDNGSSTSPEMPLLGQASTTTPETPSPAAVEAGRLKKAELAMLRLCTDLNGLVGRVIVPDEMKKDEMDALTAEIYAAAIEADLDYNAVLAGDSPLDTPTWMNNAARVLAKLRRNVPESTYHRVLEVWTGTKKDALDDPDAKYALEYAEGYFDTGKPDIDELVDLASCLLDYAFTRQGLDDDLVRATKKKPEELQRALEEAGGGKEDPVPPGRLSTDKTALLKKYERYLFVSSVMDALLDWKESLFDRVTELRAVSVYRIAMVHSGLPTGDELAQKCWSGTIRHKRKHPNTLVTIGHAALALQQLLVERGRDPDTVPYELIRDFCRTCGNDLGSRRHGCCMTDTIKQKSEQDHFRLIADFETEFAARADFAGLMFAPRVGDERITKEEGYLLRSTTLEGGGYKYEIHVKELWTKGNWQEVADRDAGRRLARRVIDEHQKAKALVKPGPRMMEFEQTTTDLMQRIGTDLVTAVNEIKEVSRRHDEIDLTELTTQMNLGRSIRWLATIVGGGALLITGKVIFLPMIMVAWVMAYTLIDRKAIAAKKEQLALGPGNVEDSSDEMEE
jgi:hypothetical protein